MLYPAIEPYDHGLLDVGDGNRVYWEVCGNPHRVTEIVLAGVTTTRRSEIDWLYRGVAPLFPAQWARFRAGVPPADRDGDLVAAYHRLLQEPDPAIHRQAAKEWCAWESALVSVDPEANPEPRRVQPAFQLAFARLVTHYFHHHAWLEEGILLRHASALAPDCHTRGVRFPRCFAPRRRLKRSVRRHGGDSPSFIRLGEHASDQSRRLRHGWRPLYLPD